jgi:hypothetical protein
MTVTAVTRARVTGPARRRALIVLAFAALAVIVVYTGISSVHRIGRGTDYNVFYEAGTAVIEGRGSELYTLHAPRGQAYRYLYPPFLAILLAPLSLLPLTISAVVWYALNVLMATHAVAIVSRTLAPPGPAVLFGLAITALTIAYLVENAFLGQVHVLILYFLILAWQALREERQVRGTLFLAAATLVKLTPGVFAVWLLATRRFRAFGWFSGWCVVLGVLLPLAVLGPATARSLLEEFSRSLVGPFLTAESGAPVGEVYRHTALAKRLSDQDLGALLQRHVATDSGLDERFRFLNAALVDPAIARRAMFAAFALILAVTIWAVARHGGPAPSRRAVDLGVALFAVVSLLVSPRLRIAYLTVLVLPCGVLLQTAMDRLVPSRARRVVVMAIAGSFVAYSLLAFDVFRALTIGWYGTAILWGGLVFLCVTETVSLTETVRRPHQTR